MSDKFTPHEKAELVRLMKKVVGAIQSLPTTTECVDCKYYNDGVCLKWREKVPDDVKETGCPEWVFDPVSPPF